MREEVILDNCILSPFGQVLHCPHCGDIYLHYVDIHVFNREKEDADKGLHCFIKGTSVSVDTNACDRNPSERRNGIKIKFWCESCFKEAILDIVCHKGNIFVGWEVK